jgi:hypothetical protein
MADGATMTLTTNPCPLRARPLVCAHTSHPIATGVAARHIIQADNTTRIRTRGATCADTGQFMVDEASNAHRSQILAKQDLSRVRRQRFVARRQLEP